MIARSGMRRILGSCLQVSPDQVRFRYGAKGKPEISESSSGLHFNLSHSDDWAILAIAGEPVGVDLEAIDTRVKTTELAQRFFSREDRDWLLAQPEELRHRAFFRLWVTREAWLKATGDGLAFPLDRLVSEWTGESITSLREHDGTRKGAVLELSPLPSGYCAAVATENASPQVKLSRLQAP
jgi:4'-phosphopantetheinyl transferase